jgi:hypothetical protein
MALMPALFASISGHGLGHLAQIAPVIDELTRRRPDLRLTLQSAIPEARLRSRLSCPFELVAERPDVGMIMAGPLEVRAEDTLQAYRRFHRTLNAKIDRQAHHFAATKPDLVLADIPYVPLAAAQRLGIPGVGLCSLNWADILASYVPAAAADAIIDQIRAIYRAAQVFLRPAPSMPMPDLGNTRQIGPVAAMGRPRRAELLARFGLGSATRIVAALLGGIPLQRSVEAWPPLADTVWLVPRDWVSKRSDFLALEDLGWPMLDVIASVDAVITKPGYGTFVEAASQGTPILSLPRADWPESPYLIEWMGRVGRIVTVSMEEFTSGRLGEALDALLGLPPKPPVSPSGVAEGADLLLAWLDRSA